MAHVASGDLLRENRRNGTALGKLADEYIKRGELVPDQVVIDMILTRLKAADCVGGVLLDGFPRTVVQAQALDANLAPQGKRVDLALYIKVSEDRCSIVFPAAGSAAIASGATTRSSTRRASPGVCDNCGGELYQRDDDRREVAENRLRVYFDLTFARDRLLSRARLAGRNRWRSGDRGRDPRADRCD